LLLDSVVINSCAHGRTKLVFSSSGCVYPNHRQTDPEAEVYLAESDAGPPFDCDNAYGYAKMMAEETLRAYHVEYGLPSVSLRFFTVYGSRMKEDHALGAWCARALCREDPFPVWGTGRQLRNWTHVSDIVNGMILAAEKVDDGRAINLGTTERWRVADAAAYVCSAFGYSPEIVPDPTRPQGPANRVAANDLAHEVLNWAPQVSLEYGVAALAEWYATHRSIDYARYALSRYAV
jgi:nucleoside-diphosphate-sugar epimerase